MKTLSKIIDEINWFTMILLLTPILILSEAQDKKQDRILGVG